MLMRRYFASGEDAAATAAAAAKAAGATTPVVNADKGAEEKHEAMIPYDRFHEMDVRAVTAEKESAAKQAQLDKIAADKKTADEKALADQGKWKDLADAKDVQLKTMAEQVTSGKIVNAVLAAAGTAGAIDPEAVVALLDKSKVKVEADGKVTGAKEAVEELLKQKPYLVAKSGSGYQMGAGASGSDPTPEEVNQMNPEQYHAWRKLHPDA
jgi:hypothetical protein